MLIIVKVLILVALIKLLLATDKPGVCAGVYAGVGVLFGLMLGVPFNRVLLGGGIGFALALVYFWLLARTEGSGVFWLVAIGGIFIGLV